MKHSLRLQLTPIQLCNSLDLIEALGGTTAGRSFASTLLQLVEHTLQLALDQGLIHPVTAEEASQRLQKLDPSVEKALLQLKALNLKPSELEKIKSMTDKIEDAVVEVEQEGNQELTEIFK